MHSQNHEFVAGPLMTQEMADEHDANSAENLRALGLSVEEAMDIGTGTHIRIPRSYAEVIKRALRDYADLVELGCRR